MRRSEIRRGFVTPHLPMYNNIFLKTLRDGRRSMLLYSLAQFIVGIYVALLFPEVATSFASMIEELP